MNSKIVVKWQGKYERYSKVYLLTCDLKCKKDAMQYGLLDTIMILIMISYLMQTTNNLFCILDLQNSYKDKYNVLYEKTLLCLRK